MFEFQANKNNPQKLLTILERFTRWWFAEPPDDETGVSQERLQHVNIPTPLKRLYSFAGEWPGGTWESIFSHQDHLCPFECLHERDGKIVFAWENQGVWIVATDFNGDDPPVYLSIDDGPFEQFCDSLSRFLVTFCLHESVFGAETLSPVADITSINIANSKIPIPIWLNAPYPNASTEGYSLSFFLVDGCVLQMGNWCGGREPSLQQRYPYFFSENTTNRNVSSPQKRSLWENPEVPSFIKRNHLEMLIRRHENVSASHLQKADHYKTLLANLNQPPR
jgi:hypothetical protein